MCMVNTQKQLEEAYLKNVYQKLIDKKNELRESMDTAKIEGNQSLKEMAGELRLNFDSYLDEYQTEKRRKSASKDRTFIEKSLLWKSRCRLSG